jgi:hypothetical protein
VGLIVLEVAGGRIAGWNSFLDAGKLFPHFGLPLTDEFLREGESIPVNFIEEAP